MEPALGRGSLRKGLGLSLEVGGHWVQNQRGSVAVGGGAGEERVRRCRASELGRSGGGAVYGDSVAGVGELTQEAWASTRLKGRCVPGGGLGR